MNFGTAQSIFAASDEMAGGGDSNYRHIVTGMAGRAVWLAFRV